MPVTPWVYLSSLGPGTGQRAATSVASKPTTSVGGKFSPMSTRSTRPQSPSACTSLRPPNVTVRTACTCGPSGQPVCTAMRLGRSTPPTGMPASSTAAKISAAPGRSGPVPDIPTTPSITRSVAAGTDCTIRPPAHRTAAAPEGRQAFRVRLLRVEQDGGRGRTAVTQKRRGPQRVAAVVAGSDHGADASAGDTPGAGRQFAGDRDRQRIGRAAHQRTIGQRSEQRGLGGADRVDGVVVPHQFPFRSTCPRVPDYELLAGNREVQPVLRLNQVVVTVVSDVKLHPGDLAGESVVAC